ncbi:MAG: CARDB domain-containing protein, partial [Anaerolineae bacterium]
MNTRFAKQIRALVAIVFILSMLTTGALPPSTAPAHAQAGIVSPSNASGRPEARPSHTRALAPDGELDEEPNGELAQAARLAVEMPPPPYVNLQVDLTSDADAEHLPAIRQEIERRGWTAAFYATPTFAMQHPDVIQSLWAGGHELGLLIDNALLEQNVEEQTQRLGEALATVRQASELPKDAPLHVRLEDYVVAYDDVVNTVRALQTLGVPSLSGVFPVAEGFSCQYCVENGRLMYPLPAEDALDVVLIPVAVATPPAGAGQRAAITLRPLDDARFAIPANEGPGDVPRAPVSGPTDVFAATLAKYDEFVTPASTLEAPLETAETEPTYVHDKYLTLVIHPSITGADAEAMAAFAGFLDHVAQGSGTLVSNEQILTITAQVMAAGYIGSLVIVKSQGEVCPNEQVQLTVNWTALLYCPTYFFRIYGKYPSESTWKLLHQGSHYVRTGSYSFNTTATVPDPPTQSDESYTFMVVGQSCSSGHEGCGYPTVQSHERDATTSVQVKNSCIDLEVRDREIYISTPAKRGENVWVTTWVFNNGKQEAKDVKVRIQDLAYGQPWHEETQTIASIPPGGKAKVFIRSKVWNVNIHKYIFTADPNNDIEEEDETNNRGETHTITGKITDPDNQPLKHIKVEYVRGGTAHYADFTDSQGKYVINANLDVIRHNVNGQIRARMEYSPQDLTDKIKFKFYDDAKWDAGHTDTYYKDTAAWSIERDQNYTGKDVQFTWQQGGRTYSTMVQSFEYFRDLNAIKFTAPNMTFEFMDDDYASQTSYQSGDTIHMWKTHTDDRGIHAHEYAHRVSDKWNNPYNPIEENWANYASSLARNTAKHDSSICVADIATDANTDANDGWFWQLAGAYWDLTRDTVIATLKNDNPTTVKQFYDKYKARDTTRTNAQIRQIFRNHGYNVTGWTLLSTRTPVAGLAGGAEFTDTYTHATSDADGDSRWDSLTISVGLNVTSTGDYEVLGFLSDGSGKNCFARYSGTFDAGSHVAPLSFDGTCIYQKALTGTYTLVDLALQDADADMLDYRGSAYSLPQPYAYTDFQKPIAVPAGTYAERVVDTDGDGEYNTLWLDVGIEVSETVTVALSADLYDGSDNPVATSRAGGILLTPGTHTITLGFDGRDLYAYGYDGAYSLRTLTIVSE